MQHEVESTKDVDKDLQALEATISTLVGEFENKHKGYRVTVRTRDANPSQIYKRSKGGYAQLELIHYAGEYDETSVSLEMCGRDSNGKVYHLVVAE